MATKTERMSCAGPNFSQVPNNPNIPEPPEGWQYGVVLTDHTVWGCGDGEDGRIRQRMRLRYSKVDGPCFLPLYDWNKDVTKT